MSCIMGIDVGTASLKVLILDECGRTKAQAVRSYQFSQPEAGWAEQHGEDWYRAGVSAIREALGQLEGGAAEVQALALSGQMHGAALLDKNYQLLRPVILHCDTRSPIQAAAIQTVFTEKGIVNALYNPVYTGFLLPSLLWVRENETTNYDKTRYVCLPKDYLKWRLCGELSTDFSDASGTLAFDVSSCCWSEETLSALDLPAEIFPSCLESFEIAGYVNKAAAHETGLKPGTLVAAGGADQVMQSIGNGAVRPGQATVNIGSAGQVCFQSEKPVRGAEKGINTFCAFTRDRWITLGATMSAGLALSWFARNIAMVGFGTLDTTAAKIPPGAGGALFLPYLNGERTPHVNPALRGVFMGLGLATEQGHLARAVMEGVVFSLRECAEMCETLGLRTDEFIASGGGAQSPLWLQIQADIFGLPLKVAECPEQAAMGAALTAAVAKGLFSSIEEAAGAMIRYQDRRWMPDPVNRDVYNGCYRRYKEAGSMLQNWTRKE